MSTTVENQRKLLIGAGIVIAILLATLVVLLFNKYGQSKEIAKQEQEIATANKLNAELQEEYDNAIAELDEALVENEDLRTMIEEQKAELTKTKNRISGMIKSGNSSKAALDDAKRELQALKDQQAQFLARIDELEAQNQSLTETVAQVTEEKKLVEEEVIREKEAKEAEIAAKEAIAEEKAAIEAAKAEVEKENVALTEKVDIASVIKTSSIESTGYKLKSGGKMVKKRYAKNVDVLKVCYTATENKVTEPGSEQFYFRILTPLGTTMYVENLGSGIFVEKENQEQMRFTKIQEVAYDNKQTQQCMNWKPDTPFAKGKYQVEIYNKGYLAGKSEFQLK